MSSTPALSCRELVELVTEYLDGAMPPAERHRFEAHLGACEPCQRYLDQMRVAISAVGRLSEEQLDPDAQAELLQAFRDWKKSAS